jgi:hypothetical protein
MLAHCTIQLTHPPLPCAIHKYSLGWHTIATILLATCLGTEANEELEALVERKLRELGIQTSPRLTPVQADNVQKAMFLLFGEVGMPKLKALIPIIQFH